jgi:predicted nucleotidyltransferase/DNA-binding XRE family transcriptional regulator
MPSAPTAAGALIREARRRAGLSQTDLAARAGVTQSVISAYESGHRQPAIPTLMALIEATGHELVLNLRREPRRLTRMTGPVGRRVRRNRHTLVAAAAAHGVTGLHVFGSVARGDDRPDSDVDLLADLPAGIGLIGLARLEAELEDIVGARVDLAPADSLKPYVRKHVEQELVAL